MTEGPLHGKIAYITGGSRGIGRAIALAFAEAGADVAICHLDDAAQATTLVQAVTARGRRGFQMEADVAAPAATRAFAAAAEAALGPCDILVNNAGINIRGAFETITEADYDRVIDVHVKGMFFMAQAVYPGMVARGHGRIINLASQLAFKGGPNISPYCTAKAGIVGIHPEPGLGGGAEGHPGERHRAGADRDGSDPRPRAGVEDADGGDDPGRAAGPAGGDRRDGAAAGGAGGCVLRGRDAVAQRRRRDALRNAGGWLPAGRDAAGGPPAGWVARNPASQGQLGQRGARRWSLPTPLAMVATTSTPGQPCGISHAWRRARQVGPAALGRAGRDGTIRHLDPGAASAALPPAAGRHAHGVIQVVKDRLRRPAGWRPG